MPVTVQPGIVTDALPVSDGSPDSALELTTRLVLIVTAAVEEPQGFSPNSRRAHASAVHSRGEPVGLSGPPSPANGFKTEMTNWASGTLIAWPIASTGAADDVALEAEIAGDGAAADGALTATDGAVVPVATLTCLLERTTAAAGEEFERTDAVGRAPDCAWRRVRAGPALVVGDAVPDRAAGVVPVDGAEPASLVPAEARLGEHASAIPIPRAIARAPTRPIQDALSMEVRLGLNLRAVCRVGR